MEGNSVKHSKTDGRKMRPKTPQAELNARRRDRYAESVHILGRLTTTVVNDLRRRKEIERELAVIRMTKSVV